MAASLPICDLVFVNVGKTQQAAFLRFLGCDRASARDDYEREKIPEGNHGGSCQDNFAEMIRNRGKQIEQRGIVAAWTLRVADCCAEISIFFDSEISDPESWRRPAPPPGKRRLRLTLCQTLYLCGAWRAADRQANSSKRNSSARPRSRAYEEPLVSCRSRRELLPRNTRSQGRDRSADRSEEHTSEL